MDRFYEESERKDVKAPGFWELMVWLKRNRVRSLPHRRSGQQLSQGDQRNKKAGRYKQEMLMDLLRIIIAILLPPLGVFLQVGIGKHFWINILLTILGYIPGMVHAVWVIAKY